MSLGKKDIVKSISTKASLNKIDSSQLLESFLEITKKQKITKISRFGAFLYRDTPQRVGRNPKTKEEHIIKSKSKLFFKPSNFIKRKLN